MNQIYKNSFTSIEQVTSQYLGSSAKIPKTAEKRAVSFEEVLNNTKGSLLNSELKFSKHASDRLADRNIDLSTTQLKRLNDGAKKAMDKGIKESLVMVDDIAFIVNIKNQTVITALGNNDDKVFTNIDGAVIM